MLEHDKKSPGPYYLINEDHRSYLRLYLLFSDLLCFHRRVNKRPLGFSNLAPECRATLPDTHTHTAVTYIQQLSPHQHSPHTHQHNTSITELPHTLRINSAAVLFTLLTDLLCVFLRASQEITGFNTHTHTQNPRPTS